MSGFRRKLDEISPRLACYVAYSRNPLPTFRDKLSVLIKVRHRRFATTYRSHIK